MTTDRYSDWEVIQLLRGIFDVDDNESLPYRKIENALNFCPEDDFKFCNPFASENPSQKFIIISKLCAAGSMGQFEREKQRIKLGGRSQMLDSILAKAKRSLAEIYSGDYADVRAHLIHERR